MIRGTNSTRNSKQIPSPALTLIRKQEKPKTQNSGLRYATAKKVVRAMIDVSLNVHHISGIECRCAKASEKRG